MSTDPQSKQAEWGAAQVASSPTASLEVKAQAANDASDFAKEQGQTPPPADGSTSRS